MPNFAFLNPVGWPEMHADCARAESYALSDPRSACFYSRRAVEHLVDYLYDVLGLPVPYVSDLAARINDAGFKAKVGVGNAAKLNLIRKLGNHAVHDQKPIPPRAALDALRELHHVMVWSAFHHSAHPDAVPLKSVFNPELAKKAAPLTRDEVAALAKKFQIQDEAHAKALAEKDDEGSQVTTTRPRRTLCLVAAEVGELLRQRRRRPPGFGFPVRAARRLSGGVC